MNRGNVSLGEEKEEEDDFCVIIKWTCERTDCENALEKYVVT